MNTVIANILKERIETLNWVDVCSGLVKEFIKTDTIIRNDKPIVIRKTFPVSCDVTNADCVAGKYMDLVPNSRKRSIIYFEDYGVRPIVQSNLDFSWKSQLRLVCWVNMNKFDYNECSISALLIQSLLSKFPIGFGNLGGFNRVGFSVAGEIPKDARIFSRYSYDESVTQYLVKPFDYFALNIETTFTTNPTCFDPIAIKADDSCPPNN